MRYFIQKLLKKCKKSSSNRILGVKTHIHPWASDTKIVLQLHKIFGTPYLEEQLMNVMIIYLQIILYYMHMV